jgi:hypothetical protein
MIDYFNFTYILYFLNKNLKKLQFCKIYTAILLEQFRYYWKNSGFGKEINYDRRDNKRKRFNLPNS